MILCGTVVSALKGPKAFLAYKVNKVSKAFLEHKVQWDNKVCREFRDYKVFLEKIAMDIMDGIIAAAITPTFMRLFL
jgi:hypothetical protein